MELALALHWWTVDLLWTVDWRATTALHCVHFNIVYPSTAESDNNDISLLFHTEMQQHILFQSTSSTIASIGHFVF